MAGVPEESAAADRKFQRQPPMPRADTGSAVLDWLSDVSTRLLLHWNAGSIRGSVRLSMPSCAIRSRA